MSWEKIKDWILFELMGMPKKQEREKNEKSKPDEKKEWIEWVD